MGALGGGIGEGAFEVVRRHAKSESSIRGAGLDNDDMVVRDEGSGDSNRGEGWRYASPDSPSSSSSMIDAFDRVGGDGGRDMFSIGIDVSCETCSSDSLVASSEGFGVDEDAVDTRGEIKLAGVFARGGDAEDMDVSASG